MKKTKSSKRILSVVLALVMILTSLPLIMVSAIGEGSYDPAPYWGDGSSTAALNTTFIATLNTDGSVSVAFPKANSQKTYDGSADKTITNYIMTITKIADDGTRTAIWSENFKIGDTTNRVGTFTVDDTEGNDLPNSIYYLPGAFTSLDAYDAEASYDVSIQAVDSDDWVSDKIHTRMTSTPYYIINDDFSPNESWVVREMLLFEEASSAEVSGGNNVTYGSGVNVDGQLAGMGYNTSAGYRFWFSGAYSQPFTAQTTWSRVHYDFNNAEEVWFYVDFTRINVNKVAFNLAANEKSFDHYRDDTYKNEVSHYGDSFSTAAVNNVNTGTISEGIYIQNADGLWESSSMTDGYFTDLSGYKGFIRIPIDYFVLQNDQYLNTRPQLTSWKDSGYFDTSNCDNYKGSDANLATYVAGITLKAGDQIVLPDRTITASAGSALINPAGTSVSDAIILYDRTETYGDGGTKTNAGTTLGGLSTYTQTVSGNVATINVTDPCYAIEDLVSAGITVAEWSDSSLYKAFYIDQVMFCQKNTGATFDDNGYVTADSAIKFPSEHDDFADDYGRKMAGFYDRTVEVPKAIAQYILQYFSEIPSLDDVNAKEQIDAIILEYIDCFGVSAVLTDEEKVNAAIETLNDASQPNLLAAYNKYKASEKFMTTYLGENLDVTTTAVESFESRVELLPDPEFADHNNEALKGLLKQLMALYETFNLSHFELLGKDEEEKFLELYKLLMGEEVKTGQSIGAYPFIPFNDFETNYTYGQYSNIYYDDPNRGSNKSIDSNNTKNFTIYTTTQTINQGSQNILGSGASVGWSVQDYRPGHNTKFETDDDIYRMDAQILNHGFVDTLGATISLNGDLTAINADGSIGTKRFATLSTTYKGTNADTWSNLPGLNLSPIGLANDTGGVADGSITTDNTRYGTNDQGEQVQANAFVMYVDFSEVKNVAMNIKFILQDSSGNDKPAYFCGGDNSKTPTIYVVDENGEWEPITIGASVVDEDSSWFQPGLSSISTVLSDGTSTALQGYKGFIRIPLSLFRINYTSGVVENFYNLDQQLSNYTFKQVKVSFWDYDTANENIGKKIHIDAMGFTYDPGNYNRVGGNTKEGIASQINSLNGITIQNMDDYFKVKTTDALKFEKAVSELDPYVGKEQFVADYKAAFELHTSLSDYQKGLEEVQYSYNLLVEKFQPLGDHDGANYDTVIQEDQWKQKYTTAAELITDLARVSTEAKEYKVQDETISAMYANMPDDQKLEYFPHLGITVDMDNDGVIDVNDAQYIVDMYEKGYHRLSSAEQANVSETDQTALVQAYYAARRAILIDGIVADYQDFISNIISIYQETSHDDDDADRIPDTEDTDRVGVAVDYERTIEVIDEETQETKTVNALEYYITMYENMSIFGKMLLFDDPNETTAYMNMYDAIEAIYDNTTPTKLGVNASGETMHAGDIEQGGITACVERFKNSYDTVKAMIEAKTVIDDATLSEAEYLLGQYEAFKRRYTQVDQLNEGYANLALLFPAAEVGEVTGVDFTNAEGAATSQDAVAKLLYTAARQNRNVAIYMITDYEWTPSDLSSSYKMDNYSVNGSTIASTDADGDGVADLTYTKLGDYANGSTQTFNPTVSLAAGSENVPKDYSYTGKITIAAYDASQISEDTDISTLTAVSTVDIPLTFTSTDGPEPPKMSYTVTIPADVQIPWDDTNAKDVSYVVNALIPEDSSLAVDVTDTKATDTDENCYMTAVKDSSKTLDYTATGFQTASFGTGTHTDAKSNPEQSITVTQAQWDAAAVGEYRTTLTYTVTYTGNS